MSEINNTEKNKNIVCKDGVCYLNNNSNKKSDNIVNSDKINEDLSQKNEENTKEKKRKIRSPKDVKYDINNLDRNQKNEDSEDDEEQVNEEKNMFSSILKHLLDSNYDYNSSDEEELENNSENNNSENNNSENNDNSENNSENNDNSDNNENNDNNENVKWDILNTLVNIQIELTKTFNDLLKKKIKK